MKKLLLGLILAISLTATKAADVNIAITTAFNLHILLQPNGPLDASPTWASTGPGTLTVDSGSLGATLTTTTTGTNTITITALSQGNPLTSRVIVTITAPPVPPATTLNPTAAAIPK